MARQFYYGKVFTGSEEEYQRKMDEWRQGKTKANKQRKGFQGFGLEHGYLWIDGEPWGPSSSGKPKKITDTFNRARREYEQTDRSREVPYPKKEGYEAHHKRILTVYDPFFKGLSDKEQRKLSKWFVDNGFGLGNIDDNFTLILKEFHNGGIHKTLRDNRMEVGPGEPGWTNFQRDPETGEILDYQYDRRGNVVTKFPNFEHLPTMESRLPAVKIYLEQVQPAMDDIVQQYELLQEQRERGEPDNRPDNVGVDDPTWNWPWNGAPTDPQLPPADQGGPLLPPADQGGPLSVPNPLTSLSTHIQRAGNLANTLKTTAGQLSRGEWDSAFTTGTRGVADMMPYTPVGQVLGAASDSWQWLQNQGADIFDVIPQLEDGSRAEELARFHQMQATAQRRLNEKAINNQLNQAYAEEDYTKFYKAGGGDAKLNEPGMTKDMVVKIGRKNLLVEQYEQDLNFPK